MQRPYRMLDEALYNFFQLPIVGNCSIINVVEFLDLFLQTLPCIETFLISLYDFLPYNEVLWCSLFDVSYHYLVFMDPVKGYSKSKLHVK